MGGVEAGAVQAATAAEPEGAEGDGGDDGDSGAAAEPHVPCRHGGRDHAHVLVTCYQTIAWWSSGTTTTPEKYDPSHPYLTRSVDQIPLLVHGPIRANFLAKTKF